MTRQNTVTNPRTTQRVKEFLRSALIFVHRLCLSLAAGQSTCEAVIRSVIHTLEVGSSALSRRSRMMHVPRLFETLLRALRRRLSSSGTIAQLSFRLAMTVVLMVSFWDVRLAPAMSHRLCRLLPLSRRLSLNNPLTVRSGHRRHRKTLFCGASGGSSIRSLN